MATFKYRLQQYRKIFAQCVAGMFILMSGPCFGSSDNLKELYERHKNTDGLKFHSQFEQDRYLYQKFFKDKRNGVFVDIGAHDGVTFSNTYFFEKTMGWTGICVEPIPEVFESLKNARQAICVQGCICSGQDTVSFLRIKGDSEMLSGILNNYDPEHLNRVQKELEAYGGSAEVITVKCYDLTNLLLSHGLTHIDYLSVDTEGGELEILKSIDFQSITIDVIDVENNLGTNRFQEFLEPLGYTKVTKLGVDEIYARKQ